VESYIPSNIDPELPKQRVLVINSYDAKVEKFRKNKEELFMIILDKMLMEISTEICSRQGFETEVISGFTYTGSSAYKRDSIIKDMMDQFHATYAIVITFLDAYFHQTEVVITKTGDGKEREAFYDIIVSIHYLFSDEKGYSRNIEKHLVRPHSSRSVISGFFALGPNIVKNSKEVFEMANDNLVEFVDDCFPKGQKCQRVLFTANKFVNVGRAVSRRDYSKAMIESQRFLNYQDLLLAAKANYNCAVLFERKNQYSNAKSHLVKSLSLYALPEAKLMMNDYEFIW
jgi:hypothetical protein